MIFPENEGPQNTSPSGVIDMETGYDLTQPLGLQQPMWDRPEDRELLARLVAAREAAGLPEINDQITRVTVDENTPRTVADEPPANRVVARRKGAKKPPQKAPVRRGRQIKSASDRAAKIHEDLETS